MGYMISVAKNQLERVIARCEFHRGFRLSGAEMEVLRIAGNRLV